MNWNLLGRILIFVNPFLSLGFCFWAFGIYSQRIDLTNQKTAAGEGKFLQQTNELKGLQEAVERGQARWEAARGQVLSLEARRPELLRWYAGQLQTLRDNGPVQALVYDKGELRWTEAPGQWWYKGFPVLGPVLNASGQPMEGLAGIQALNNQYNRTQAEIDQTTQEIAGLQDQIKQMTQRIGNAQSGLRQRLARDREEQKNSQDEQEEFLKPHLYNYQVQAHILEKRRQALEARLKELEGARVARQR